MRECVAAVIVAEKKVLLGKRNKNRSFYPDIWDVFGGHLLTNETHADALKRELREELGITPTHWKFLLKVDEPHPENNGDGIYYFYLVDSFDGEPRNLQPEEHAFIEWFTFAEAVKLPFVDAFYLKLIEKVLRFESPR